MHDYSNKLFMQLPSFIPKIVESYTSDKITVFKAKNVFSEPKGFDSYKFLMPLNQILPFIIEKRKYTLEPNKIFPINPNQIHSSSIEAEVLPYIPIFIENDFMREMANLLYGKKTTIYFETANFKPDQHLYNLIQLFLNEVQNKQKGYEFVLQSLNMQIVIHLLRSVDNNCITYNKEYGYTDYTMVGKVIEFLMENYDKDFSLEDLANLVNYSSFHFIKIFKEHTGKTPFEYLLDIKIEKAKELLKSSKYNITEICFKCGFNNRSHFSTVFKRKTGVSPLNYRKSQ